jgi:hypothetical protein
MEPWQVLIWINSECHRTNTNALIAARLCGNMAHYSTKLSINLFYATNALTANARQPSMRLPWIDSLIKQNIVMLVNNLFLRPEC